MNEEYWSAVRGVRLGIAHQLESLEALGLGEEWLRAVCWGNGVRLFGVRSV